jgi:hypothetical protein
MFHIQNANLRKSILAAITLMSLSTNGEAKPKLSEIKGLPQTGDISQIRTGSDAQGNIVVSWQGPNTLYVDRISSAGVPEASATTIASGYGNYCKIGVGPICYGIHDLVVKQDGSYLAAWIGDTGSPTPQSGIKAVLSGNLSNVLDFGLVSNAFSLDVFSFSDGFKVFDMVNVIDTVWYEQSNLSVFDSQGQPSANPPFALPSYAAVTTNTAGDYVMAILGDIASSGICEDTTGSAQSMKTTLALQKNDGEPVSVSPYNQAQTFNFGDGPKPNEKVELSILNPKVVSNASGEIVLVWLEELATTQRKANGGCAYLAKQTLVAQRFNNDLSVKDATPIVVASTQNKTQNKFMVMPHGGVLGFATNGPFLGDYGIDMNDAGDFVVAYAWDKPFSVNGSVMARQFVNDKGTFVAGKAIKMPFGKKPKTSHPKEKGIISRSYMLDLSISITNAANNEFAVVWHHDYSDYFLAKSATPPVWTSHGYSILKAARYSSQ